MNIAPFETEQFFAQYEFNTPYQLCNSDCESLSMSELLELAGVAPEQFLDERLGYSDSRGRTPLREAIAARHPGLAPDDVVVLGTPVEGIYLAARALLEPGDEVVVLTPAYDALVNLFEHVAGPDQVRKWRFRAERGRWALRFEDLLELVSSRTRLLVVNFPHNPTGFQPSPDLQRQIVDLADRLDIRLFSDEMYHGLVHSGTPAIPSAAELSPRTVALSGLSKTYGLPGLRCGWLLLRDPALRERVMNWKYYTSICPPVPSEALALAAVHVADELRLRNVARIERNLESAEAFFSRWPELFDWRRPQAGSTALVGFDVPSVSALSRRLATEEGLLIQSATMLGGDDHQMRIGLGREGFADALQRFETWLRRPGALASLRP
ncbi:MAG: aminotransferase class I/II-fold pyridoxal phosphate-dependent enzyme [Lysobacterales bacterium]